MKTPIKHIKNLFSAIINNDMTLTQALLFFFASTGLAALALVGIAHLFNIK